MSGRDAARLRLNTTRLVMQGMQGQIAHPVGRENPYRIGQDGVPRVLPGTGGITINCRIGDPCVGLAADHVEPGAALHNNGQEIIGARNGPNRALITSACVGNCARVASGPVKGAVGLVTGKHGGVDHLLVDFDTRTLCRLNIGDRIQIYTYGLGLQLLDFPQIAVTNCAPGLLRRWSPVPRGRVLEVRVTHILPAAIMGSGLGKNSVLRGDIDIQLFDAPTRRRYGLETLRFGDLVAVTDSDTRYGAAWRSGRMTIGVVVHSDSTVAAHGPGMTALLTGPTSSFRPIRDARANIAFLYRRRAYIPPRANRPLAGSLRSTPLLGRAAQPVLA
ncbi:MAG TPA: DUF4438 domain-containing protein [Rhizomicrobium sp.]|nr:DUF4438 domain-containing protein [Rhizomicrobium sp.]